MEDSQDVKVLGDPGKWRFFFVSYSFSNHKGYGLGSCGRICKDGKMFNRKKFKSELDVDNVTILSIKEMNKIDFELFMGLEIK